MTNSSTGDIDLWSYPVPQTSRADRGDVRRAFDRSLHPELGVDGCRTLYEGFRRGAQINPLGPCMGFRAVSTTGFPTPYIYSSYSECLARVNAFAAGMDSLNLLERNDEGLLVVCEKVATTYLRLLFSLVLYCLLDSL
jgi:long-chain acyl-CoA synthetase